MRDALRFAAYHFIKESEYCVCEQENPVLHDVYEDSFSVEGIVYSGLWCPRGGLYVSDTMAVLIMIMVLSQQQLSFDNIRKENTLAEGRGFLTSAGRWIVFVIEHFINYNHNITSVTIVILPFHEIPTF